MFTHFYSDPHFGHNNIIEFCDRPFSSIEQMNAALINNYNAVVGEEDHVLWVGDCFFLSADASKAVMKQLNGTKSLVIGNHDSKPFRMVELGFTMVCQEAYISVNNRPIRVYHYPYKYGRSDPREVPYAIKRNQNEILMHGHTHSKKRKEGKAIHVGCDAWNYAPISLHAIKILTRLIEDKYG